MFDFFLNIIIFGTLGVLVLLSGRSLNRIQSVAETDIKDIFDRFFDRLPISKLDAMFNAGLEKGLRLLKVTALKTENFVHHHLNRLVAARKKENRDQVFPPSSPQDQSKV